MNLNNFTIKSQQAIQAAGELAAGQNQQAIETAHLLKALMMTDENIVNFLFGKLGVNTTNIGRTLDAMIQRFPKVSGGEPYLGNAASRALQNAISAAQAMKDEYVSIDN